MISEVEGDGFGLPAYHMADELVGTRFAVDTLARSRSVDRPTRSCGAAERMVGRKGLDALAGGRKGSDCQEM
jgi:hypothetical protein